MHILLINSSIFIRTAHYQSTCHPLYSKIIALIISLLFLTYLRLHYLLLMAWVTAKKESKKILLVLGCLFIEKSSLPDGIHANKKSSCEVKLGSSWSCLQSIVCYFPSLLCSFCSFSFYISCFLYSKYCKIIMATLEKMLIIS